MLFERYYEELAIYRSDIIIPFGFLSMLIQAVAFAWIYERRLRSRAARWSRALAYGAFGRHSLVELHDARRRRQELMASVPDYILIETAFTAVQWIMVGPLTALAFGRATHAGEQVRAASVAR